MILYDPTDTICALSTPPGTGAIAVVRISGSAAFPMVDALFSPTEKGLSIQTAAPNTIHHGTLMFQGKPLDEILLSLFRAPRSYTGEDLIELSCHGSPFIQEQLLQALITSGCRFAKPGEFTLRAFLNGKFDLSQSEAVADLIAAQSQVSHDQALNQMRGGFSRTIRELRKKLLHFTSLIELELDFSEEQVEFASRTDLFLLLDEMETELSRMIQSFVLGNVIKKGIPVAITGKPNVGKSTLLNTLLNEERAIVSEIPGTTRDAIEDTIVIEGYSFRFIDTAGLRASEDEIETMGIDRTRTKISEASVILYLFDASTDAYQDVAEALQEIFPLLTKEQRLILIGNKTDLLGELPGGFQDFVEHETLFISAKRKENIQLIAGSLLETVKHDQVSDGTIVSNARHLEALQHALHALRNVHEGLDTQLSLDLIASDIRQALHHLGEITGEITTNEILETIFSRFCIGK